MKRVLTLAALALAMLCTLSACDGETADLVFVNDSDTTISAVLVGFEDRGGGAQNADGSPLKRGESFGFEAGEYPVTVTVYETPPEPFSDIEDIRQEELASIVIQKAPPEGERWYVTARDSGSGLMLTASTVWSSEVPEATTGGGFWFPSGTMLLAPFLWGPLVLLAAVCILTLNHLEPQRRRGLFALFFTMLGVAAVLFGGALVLDQNGLAWRTWFQESMGFVLWLVGLATGIMTVVYARRWIPERYKGWGKAVVYLSVLCLISAMFVGTVVGGLWCMGPGEQVATYEGKKVIFGTWTWMGESYELYEYHGPLVRGSAIPDWDWSLLEGAIIEAG